MQQLSFVSLARHIKLKYNAVALVRRFIFASPFEETRIRLNRHQSQPMCQDFILRHLPVTYAARSEQHLYDTSIVDKVHMLDRHRRHF